MKMQMNGSISNSVSESAREYVRHIFKDCPVILFILFFMTSCAAPVAVYVDVLEPSLMSRKFPADSLLVVNNLQRWKPFEVDDTLYIPVQTDTLFKQITQKLVDNDCSKYLVRIDSGLVESDSCFIKSLPDSLLEASSVDYNIRTILSIDNAYAKVPLVTISDDCWADGYICLTYNRIGIRPTQEKSTIVGRLYYKGNKIKEEELQADLVRRLSDDIVRELMPFWQTVGRTIYTSLASDLRYGYLAYISGNREQAEQLWKQAAEESTFRKLRVAAYVNLAFLKESEDSFTKSLVYLDCAEREMNGKDYASMKQLIDKYRKILKHRIEMSQYLK